MPMPRSRRSTKFWLMLCVGVLLFSTLSSSTAQAAYVIPRMLTNDITQFSSGSFQRTQLSSFRRGGTTFQDSPGAAQLMPLGIVKFKNRVLSKLLPYQLIRMGVGVVGNRIYVIGGVAQGGQKPNNGGQYNSESTDLVYSTEIDPTTGDMIGDAWRAESTLPAVVSSDQAGLGGNPQSPVPASVVNSPAIATAQIGGQRYIYVIGGNTRLPGGSLRDFSSNAVRVGIVAGDGTITWKALPGAKIPAATADEPGVPAKPKYGVQGASAVTMTVNGSTYVYLIGGLQRYLAGDTIVEAGSRAVFYAKVNSDGTLRKKDGSEGWERMVSRLPVGSSNINAGLWDAAAVAGQYNAAQSGDIDKVIHVFGGQMTSARFEGGGGNEYNAKVIQLYVITDANGWPVPTGGDAEDDTLPEARVGLGAVTFRGKHYIGGGATGSSPEPTRHMLTTYVEDDMSLPNFGGPGGANFIVDRDSFNEPRAYHGMAIVPAGESAYVYILGGQTSAFASTTPLYSDQVIFGKIGGNDESEAVGLAPDGWYYSQPVEFLINNAEVQEINWSTLMTDTTGMDIEMYYRVSSSASCSVPIDTDWQAVDGDPATVLNSKNGENTVSLQGVAARCFQYRARFKGGSIGELDLPKETPSLLYVSLKILVPGSPDLRADQPGDVQAVTTPEGNLTAFIVQIHNKATNTDGRTPTLDTNIEGKGGSFFVDLIIYKEGDQITVPTIPVNVASNNDGRHLCASVDKSAMPVDAVQRINQWYLASNEPTADCKSEPRSVLDYIKQRGSGKYTVFVVVDSYCGTIPYGCVDERDAPNGEGNNVTRYEFNYNGRIVYQQSVPFIQVRR